MLTYLNHNCETRSRFKCSWNYICIINNILFNKYILQPHDKNIIWMVNLDQISFYSVPWCFNKMTFFHIDNCISLLFILQMVKIYPKDHLLQVEIWVSVYWKIIFSFSKYRASENNLKSILSLRNWKSDITASLKHNFTLKLYAMKLC